ncbi:thiol peroxidase, atypical 2-Cys peroxiredoxin [Atopostipes suicloacalis DSM 15692]|uniref:Thiol peroxidase, atypical 2-Cys peroxiredoxin n=1 Tax=Atopostipes suicloacalis DSM 15692 TaxID=1121025 RepID=A0A1M4VYK7_9LACT|nr:redoxin domain-containing protein [Atopostipes suicloacalis]SHE74029.1 thiol peroxidase, atypical 2-Cys peroxiredoxin [Atopostipes suicloacalis DSM 15692]
MQVTFKGDPLEVKGTQPIVGERAPDATLTNRQGEEVKLSSFFGNQPVVISVVPDVQTRTCELQTKRFSKELAEKDVVYLTVSRNTVDEFNQWNDENDLDLTTLSDANREFGKAYGLGVDMGGDERLARSVFLVDPKGIIQYVQIVEEIADEPNYDATLEAIDNL